MSERWWAACLRRWPGIHREASYDSIVEKEGCKKAVTGFAHNPVASGCFLPLWSLWTTARRFYRFVEAPTSQVLAATLREDAASARKA